MINTAYARRAAMNAAVFVIMPFGNEFSSTYTAIENSLAKAKQKCIRSDLEYKPGLIIEQVHDNIKFALYCIADVSPDSKYGGQPNPNVLYELGVAHAHGTPVVVITQKDDLPFNLSAYRWLKYLPNQTDELENALLEYAVEIERTGESDASLLSQMLAPSSIRNSRSPFVVATSPLSFRSAFQSLGGWEQSPKTFSDYSGVSGILQAFGTMYGLRKMPELVNPDDFRKSVLWKAMHLYCIGSPKSNRWSGRVLRKFFENRSPTWRFQVDPMSKDLMNPKVRIARNGKPHQCPTGGKSRNRWDYGLLIRGPHPTAPGSQFMLMAGRSALGTQAACLAATTPKHISTLKKKMEQEAKSINLQNHRHAFCAVVSMQARIYPNKSSDNKQKTNRWVILEKTLKFHEVEALSKR